MRMIRAGEPSDPCAITRMPDCDSTDVIAFLALSNADIEVNKTNTRPQLARAISISVSAVAFANPGSPGAGMSSGTAMSVLVA